MNRPGSKVWGYNQRFNIKPSSFLVLNFSPRGNLVFIGYAFKFEQASCFLASWSYMQITRALKLCIERQATALSQVDSIITLFSPSPFSKMFKH